MTHGILSPLLRAPVTPSQGFKALICVGKKKNHRICQRMTVFHFFISVSFKSTARLYVSPPQADWVSPEWPRLGGWCCGVGRHPGRAVRGFSCVPREPWMDGRWGGVGGGPWPPKSCPASLIERTCPQSSRAVSVSLALPSTSLVRSQGWEECGDKDLPT